MARPFALASLLSTLAAAGCASTAAVPTSDGATASDAATSPPSDLAIGDAAAVDSAPPDQAIPDLFVADLSAADLATPDLTTSDLAAPDLATPDLATPDLATPDLATPDLATPDLLQCSAVSAAPDGDPWAVRVSGPAFNQVVTANNTDYLVGPNDYIRLGASLAWGGSVTYFGLTSIAGSNVIDANDAGRELQVALYDPARAHQPCAGTATCVTAPATCGNSISYLGWDPVQGGDRCGNGATVLSHGRAGDALRLVVQPLQWNPDWDHPNCDQQCGRVPVGVTYTLDYRFVDQNVVEIAMEVSSQEAITHDLTEQEFPTLYVAHGQNGPDLPLLFDAGHNAVAIDTLANDNFYYANFTSPASWVTWQNSQQNYGVAIGTDQGIANFQAWRGDGVKSPYFHNVRPRIAFGLPAGGLVRGISYLALGDFSTVKGLMEATRKRRPPFGHVDAPAAGPAFPYAAGTPVTFSGWVLDTTRLSSVRVEIDGVDAGTVSAGMPRSDVCQVYPNYDGCPNVGFAGAVPTAGLSPCPHLARIIATDGDGNSTVLGERVIAPR